ncbi:MAG: intradiol ring-cleavage dioxygenase [Burkholderiales bacterium]|nr:MAG: intradiol ring-cleavage dioxygenase [Burkholderiales bacterium]
MNFDESTLTDAVLARMDKCQDARFKLVMTSLIRHLHDFIREVEPTEAEWFAGVRFLTETGQKCDDVRQEFILMSDTLGVSMLVDAINHRFPGGATPTTVFGPFFVEGAPNMPHWGNIAEGLPGTPCFVQGTVRDTTGEPIAGAVIDIWQTDGVEGLYDVQRPNTHYGRGKITTDAEGRYAFRTVQPISYPVPDDGPVGDMLRRMGRHPVRPAHIHTMLNAPGYQTLTTHLFVKDDPYLESDAVFGVKEALIAEFVPQQPGMAPDGKHCDRPFSTVHYDFVMAGA